MRILNVATALQKASGVTTFVENVVAELRALGHEVDVLVKAPALECVPDFSRYDIVHIHGLWDLWLHKTALASCCARTRIVWSPHGMLQPWALKNKWWKKFAALAAYQWLDLHRANLIHVTAQSEVRDVRRLGLRNNIVVAPLGVRVKDMGNGKKNERTLLFVSRVQKKKGLPNLLNAWARLPEDLKKDWTIRIVGPDQDNHTAELRALAENLGILRDVEFVGPLYDEQLDAAYSAADLFILPTHSENFGSVVIEALAHGVPVICTKEAPWAELETHKCGWWIDDNVNALVQALKEALPLHCTPTTLSHTSLVEMGKNGLELVKAKYDWRVVGKTLADAYLSISQGCEKGRCSECAELYDTCSP